MVEAHMNPGVGASPRNVFLFSGQGSQYFHMGRALFDADPCFRGWMRALDEVARGLLGESVLAHVYDPQRRKSEAFRSLRHSSASILMSECALAFTLVERGVEPDIVCGASLGEFAAAVVAGALSFPQALRIVLAQSDCFERRCEPGAVVAVLAPVELFERDAIFRGRAELVSASTAEHFVISGLAADVGVVVEHLRARSILTSRLPVAFAYHSRHIDAARSDVARVLQTERIQPPRVPMYSCARPGPLGIPDREHLWQAVRGPLRFAEALGSLPGDRPTRLIDLSPSGTLANLARRCCPRGRDPVEIVEVMTPFGGELGKLEALIRAQTSARRSAVDSPTTSVRALTRTSLFGGTAWLFPGQGAQHRGMGRGLFERFPTLTILADEILGLSVEDLCLRDPEGRLRDTAYTQPALYVVNALTYRARLEDGAREPDVVAGHSLGEYNALHAAGVLDFSTGLRLVQRRGALMARAEGGAMAAVLGLREAEVRRIIARHDLELDVANLNAPTQIVVSGPRARVLAAQLFFEQARCRAYVVLNVSGAFHSRWMEPAAARFAELVASVEFRRPRIPVISNVLAAPYPDADLGRLLVDQISRPVRWTETITGLARQGIEDFEEVGPGVLLSKLTARILEPAPRPEHSLEPIHRHRQLTRA